MKAAWWGGAAAVALAIVWARPVPRTASAPRVTIAPAQLVADGYDTATLTVDDASGVPPKVTVETAHAASVQEITTANGGWRAQIRAGVMPASVVVRVEVAGRPASRVRLTTTLDAADSAQDGTPDFLRLDDAEDVRAFRRWFTFLAETQYFTPEAARPKEIVDCAALIRYAYREALRVHDGAWATETRLPFAPGIGAVAKYQYPFTALGADLFRVKAGRFEAGDLSGGRFAQFADAKTLQLRNTFFVTRDISRAERSDLLFYRHESDGMPFHSMIYLGESQIERGSERYLVYHTGPGPDEIRRPSVRELLRFPEADWRPLADNPRFLGVYRWNILSKRSPERS